MASPTLDYTKKYDNTIKVPQNFKTDLRNTLDIHRINLEPISMVHNQLQEDLKLADTHYKEIPFPSLDPDNKTNYDIVKNDTENAKLGQYFQHSYNNDLYIFYVRGKRTRLITNVNFKDEKCFLERKKVFVLTLWCPALKKYFTLYPDGVIPYIHVTINIALLIIYYLEILNYKFYKVAKKLKLSRSTVHLIYNRYCKESDIFFKLLTPEKAITAKLSCCIFVSLDINFNIFLYKFNRIFLAKERPPNKIR
ncbi:MAG: hypothetical protein LBV55_04280 [Acholeplasmatales bacterium]|jgi:hypothetical protein|nr:hypothetical protein [Acholeplasmatales bacterium]